MYVYYHSDIISRVQTAFKTCIRDSKNGWQLVESMSVHRLSNLKETDDKPAEQVALTLYGILSDQKKYGEEGENSIEDVPIAPFQPEKLENDNIRKMMLDHCAQGRFVPFMLSFDEEDNLSRNNTAVIVAGIGEAPDENFMVMTINIPKLIRSMKAKFVNENGRKMSLIVYPLMFDVPAKVFASIIDEDCMHVRTFIMKKEDEPKEEIPVEGLELEEIQRGEEHHETDSE